MSFTALVFRNLFRQRVRTLLTLLGICIGVATVVALGSITEGLKGSMGEFVHAGGADFLVAQEGASDLSFGAVPESEWRAVAARPDVARATGLLFEVAEVGSNPFFLVFGYEPEALQDELPELVSGRLLDPVTSREAPLGVDAAKELDADAGATVVLDGTAFEVVGIYRTRERLRDAGAIVPLATLQEKTGRRSVVTAVHVMVAKGADPHEVALAIERDNPQLAVLETASDWARSIRASGSWTPRISRSRSGGRDRRDRSDEHDDQVRYERTREIGILRAVGWRGSRILRMIFLESLALCLLAAVVGTLIGILLTRAVLLVPSISTFLVPAYTLDSTGRTRGRLWSPVTSSRQDVI